MTINLTLGKLPVALFTRAWIEIQNTQNNNQRQAVALFTRAWIEIALAVKESIIDKVALFTRAWIEISLVGTLGTYQWSPSSRGRGLKSPTVKVILLSTYVALFTRAWIEIFVVGFNLVKLQRRPLHEGVD